jgi:hypothetical protein
MQVMRGEWMAIDGFVALTRALLAAAPGVVLPSGVLRALSYEVWCVHARARSHT